MAIVGGLRLRLIKDNFHEMIRQSLEDLGWFNTSRRHLPVTLTGSQIDTSIELKPNIVAISTEDMSSDEWELGSGMEEKRWDVYIDIFAENEAVGLHLAGDIADIVKGKMPSIGRTIPFFDVLDLTQATPTELFKCEIDDVDIAKVRDWVKPYNQFWWTVGLVILDYYDNEDDA